MSTRELAFNNLTLRELERTTGWRRAVIVFDQDSFDRAYTETERSYEISSRAHFFDPTKISKSLHGACLDGSEFGVRLDWLIYAIDNPWKVERCYVVEWEEEA